MRSVTGVRMQMQPRDMSADAVRAGFRRSCLSPQSGGLVRTGMFLRASHMDPSNAGPLLTRPAGEPHTMHRCT